MIILVVNAGSSSLKYKLYNMEEEQVLAGGVLERIGEQNSISTHTISLPGSERQIVREQEISDHQQAMHLVLNLITDPLDGVLENSSQILAVGHRVVQGGEAFASATLIDETIKEAIRDHNRLAPLHNPPNLIGIEVAEKLLPETPNIAVFDTEFHQSMPPKAYLYALPYAYYEDFKVRRYGFHGTSHRYISEQAAKLMSKKPDAINLITLHLGNGCSICAVEKGKSVDTSMGMTPLAGIMMGTRSGDFDPAIIGYLLQEPEMNMDKLDTILNQNSGLKGVCGLNDWRDIHEAAAKGNSRAQLALEMFCYQAKKYIGAYAAILGNVDALVFTAGVGENDAIVRATICENLSCLGIRIDAEQNRSKQSKPFALHSSDSRVQVWVVPTNEELQIAKETLRLLRKSPDCGPH